MLTMIDTRKKNVTDADGAWKRVVALASFVTAVIAINSGVMIPMIRFNLEPVIEQRIRLHQSEQVHVGTVPRPEIEQILKRLDDRREMVESRLVKIEQAIERVGQRAAK